jgi:methylthioribose-1-phosphate isomerase
VTTPVDPSRRAFFRRFAGDLIASAAELTNVVSQLREESAAEAANLLGEGTAGTPARVAPSGFRTPFRLGPDDDVLMVIDQRRLPESLVEVPVRSAPDGARAIHDRVVRGAPAIGQVGAISLALTAKSMRLAQPYARRAVLEGAADGLRGARPVTAALGRAIDRLMERYRAIGPLSEDGEGIAMAMWNEAMAIVAEATSGHGAMADAGLTLLPQPSGRPLQVLTHGNTGPLASGQFGTALGIVQAAHHAERPVHVWVDETRPDLAGARLTTWELAQAGVDHTLVPDAAAGSLLAAGQVDVVLVGAERIAANGDTANDLGTYPLAELAARHGVPFYVVAPLASVDLATPDGAAIPIEERAAEEVASVRGVRIGPPATAVFNPGVDITPAALISAIVTEAGVLRPPFGPALRAAVMAAMPANAAMPAMPAVPANAAAMDGVR